MGKQEVQDSLMTQRILTQPLPKRWRIVSTYLDGERISEAVGRGTQDGAEEAAQRVREFRADQDEGPVVTVEELDP